MTEVYLTPLDRWNWRMALEVRAGASQLQFVAGHQPVALVLLAKSYVGADGLFWKPFGIFESEAMIGVVALAFRAAKCEIFHLLIDRAHQGRGLGTAAVSAIVGHLRRDHSDCTELSLTVHPRNERALRLYRSAGFHSTNEQRDGEPIWRLWLG